MRSHLLFSVLLALPFLAAPACGGGERKPAGDEAGPRFEARPFVPYSGDRWIGNAVCYGPHRDGQRPGGASPSKDELREDLRLMQPHWSLLRTYGAGGFVADMLELIRAEKMDFKVVLGAWVAVERDLDSDDAPGAFHPEVAAANDREIAAAIDLARAYPDIVAAVCVGNETQVDWSAHRCPPEVLIRRLREVRSAVSVPVTTADDFKYWILPESRAVAAEVDFIITHAHPLWNGILLPDAMSWLTDRLAEVRAMHPDRDVVIGETGWATSALDHGEQGDLIRGRTGETEQKVFIDRAVAWADSTRETMFLFEAFDENWKGGDDPAEVEKHWGLFRADRTPKTVLAE